MGVVKWDELGPQEPKYEKITFEEGKEVITRVTANQVAGNEEISDEDKEKLNAIHDQHSYLLVSCHHRRWHVTLNPVVLEDRGLYAMCNSCGMVAEMEGYTLPFYISHVKDGRVDGVPPSVIDVKWKYLTYPEYEEKNKEEKDAATDPGNE